MNSTFQKRAALRFRHFAHRGYSAFASMHREVTIGCVSARVCNLEMLKAGHAVVLPLLLLAGSHAVASESTDSLTAEEFARQLSLQEVLVTSEKAEVNAKAYRLVATISHDEIAALPTATISDILGYLPGVDVRSRGGSGGQADVSMRGGTFDQVLVMINGVNLTDAHTGHYTMNLPVSVSMIERIEVLQGTSAHLFGLNAFAGAINIVTKLSPDPSPQNTAESLRASGEATNVATHLRLTAGRNGLVNPELGIRLRKGEWYMNASAEYNRAEGYAAPDADEKEQEALKNTDLKMANIFVQTGYKGLDIQLGAQYKDAGAGMFYGSSLDQFDATRTAFGSATYTHRWGPWSMDAQVMYRANYDRYEWHRGQRLYGNFHFTQNAAANLKGHYASRIGTTTIGLEVRNENIHSTNLGDTIHPNGQVPNVADFDLKDVRVLDLVKGDNRLNINYFAEQTFQWRQLSASLGVSGNWNNRFGHNVAGGANLGYQYAKDGRIYMNANRSLRLPTFTDLYYDAGQQLGDRNLRPEQAWVWSIGTQYSKGFGEPINGKWSKGQLSLTADAYYRWGRDIIDWVRVEDDARRPYHATNQNRVNATGLEASIAYRWNEWLPCVRASYAYTYMDLDLEKTGSRYLDYLSHHLTAQIEHAFWVMRNGKGSIGASWTLTAKIREGQYDSPSGTTENYRPVVLLDGQIYYRNAHVRVAAECTNLTNRHYYDYGGILQPGAWPKITITAYL